MALEGALRDLGLAEVIQLLSGGRRTGALRVSGGAGARGAIMRFVESKPSRSELFAAETPKTKVAPQKLFEDWPQDRKPDLVIVLTGQMHGYLQKCGCSSPQKGGLERRYNFMESLRARGWEVIGLDVGDVLHPLPYTPTIQQTLTKYEFAMGAAPNIEGRSPSKPGVVRRVATRVALSRRMTTAVTG